MGKDQRSFRFPIGSSQSAASEAGAAKFGGTVPLKAARFPRRQLSKEELGPGFFTDPALKSPDIYEFTPDPEIPLNYVWVRAGQFSTGPRNSDVEDDGGTLVEKAKIVSVGKRLKIYSNAGTGSFTGRIIQVRDAEDRRFLGKSGWWGQDQLSSEAEPDAQKTS